MGLIVHLNRGGRLKNCVNSLDLVKTKRRCEQSSASRAVDSRALTTSLSGAEKPTSTRLWYIVPARLHRRQR